MKTAMFRILVAAMIVAGCVSPAEKAGRLTASIVSLKEDPSAQGSGGADIVWTSSSLLNVTDQRGDVSSLSPVRGQLTPDAEFSLSRGCAPASAEVKAAKDQRNVQRYYKEGIAAESMILRGDVNASAVTLTPDGYGALKLCVTPGNCTVIKVVVIDKATSEQYTLEFETPLQVGDGEEKSFLVAMPENTLRSGFTASVLTTRGTALTVNESADYGIESGYVTCWGKTTGAGLVKADFEGLAQDAVKDVKIESGNLVVTLSDSRSFVCSSRKVALVSVDAEDWITINGQRSGHKIVELPYYHISENGHWMNEDTDTGVAAVGDEYVQETRKEWIFHFSDGSSKSFSKGVTYEMHVSKTEKEMDIYIGEKGDSEAILYPFKYRNRAYSEGTYPCFLDNWGFAALVLCNREGTTFTKKDALFLNGEAELAYQVTDGRDDATFTYVGGTLHGFENIISSDAGRQLTITVDGVAVGETETFSLKQASRIQMEQKTLLYQAYTTTNPFAEVTRNWTIADGRLTIRCSVKFLRSMKIKAAQYGMICVLRRYNGNTSLPYLTRYAVRDNKPFHTYDITDDWQTTNVTPGLGYKDPNTHRITEYGDMGYSFSLVDDGSDLKNGGMFCGTNGNAYNKIYFDLVGNYDASEGEVITGQVHWEIEKTRP